MRKTCVRGTGCDTPAEWIDKLRPYAQAGIDRVILHVNLGASRAEALNCIQRFAEEVMPHFSDSPGTAIAVEAAE